MTLIEWQKDVVERGRRLRELRELAGYSGVEFCEVIGPVSSGYLSNAENGVKGMSEERLRLAAQALAGSWRGRGYDRIVKNWVKVYHYLTEMPDVTYDDIVSPAPRRSAKGGHLSPETELSPVGQAA